MEHKSFRQTPPNPDDVKWSRVFRITTTTKKESGYFAFCFFIGLVILSTNHFGDSIVGIKVHAVVSSILDLGFFAHGIRWVYLIIKEKTKKKKNTDVSSSIEIKTENKVTDHTNTEQMHAFKIIQPNLRKIALLVVPVVLIIIIFYWYQVRPSRIMHACSWFKVTLAPVPADPGITIEEAKIQSLEAYKTCRDSFSTFREEYSNSNTDSSFFNNIGCSENSIGYKAPTPYQPERDTYRQASKTEYEFCLHDKGLR